MSNSLPADEAAPTVQVRQERHAPEDDGDGPAIRRHRGECAGQRVTVDTNSPALTELGLFWFSGITSC